ncbi:MAG: DUF4295 domain-containing protein [FCB group bacterium]|nr:DUF4295 domain-containing protein [FCB group bacterium]
MAKKQVSFAEKARRGKHHEDLKFVKYVKSVQSEKTGSWRFNESMIRLRGGESLDDALKRMDVEAKALDIELPTFKESVPEPEPEVADPRESEVEATAAEETEQAGQ